jgi:glycogen(starch) synthase
MVTEFYPPVRGGLEFHVQNLAKELDQRGHDMHVATLGAANGRSNDGGVTVHDIRSTASRLPLLYADRARPFHLPIPDFEVRRELRGLLERIRPDVIHAHNWMAASLPRSDVPLVLTSHDYAWACPKRTYMRRDGSTCNGPSLTRCVPCASPQYGVAKAILVDTTTRLGRRTVRPDFHICVSDAVAGAISPFVRRNPIVIPNFIPADLADRQGVPVPGLPNEPFALFAGEASRHKGIDMLLEAWALGAPCPLVLATLRPLDRALPSQVTQVRLDRDQMVTAYRSACVVVVPSLWPEPCPSVVLEAMAMGVPVVASAVGGIPELLRDRVEGRLVPPGETGPLLQAITELLADGDMLAAMGSAGRRRAEEYSLATMATSIEDVYHAAIRGATLRGTA